MADISLTITIPESYVPRVRESFHGMANREIQVSHKNANLTLKYDPKGMQETEKQFAQRVLKSLGKTLIGVFEYNVDVDRHAEEVNKIAIPSVEIPDDLIN
jgi:hypothetical protein